MADFVRVPSIAVDVGEGLRLRSNEPSNGKVAIMQGDEYLFHLVRHGLRCKACPFHSLGFFSVKNMAKQYPVHSPWPYGFGMVRGKGSGRSLADVQLPAAEINRGWFHGFRV